MRFLARLSLACRAVGKQRRVLLLLLVLGETGCNRPLSREDKMLRAELRQALREKSYEKATALARRVIEKAPEENGAWARLAQAQMGSRDYASLQQTLGAWRRTVPRPSGKLDEFTGDLAARQNDPTLALQSWNQALRGAPKNVRVLRKVARLQHAQQHWAEEETAWSVLIDVQESASARIHRAMARRRLHRWDGALEDFRRAQQLAPQHPEVQRGARLFVRLGKFLASIRELDAQLIAAPNDAQLLGDRALMFLRGGDPELALADSAHAAQIAPWAVRPKLFAALALIDLDRATECEKLGVIQSLRLQACTPEFLETLSRLDAEISVERNNAELYVARAWQLNEIEQPVLALQDAETARELDQKSAGASAESSYALMKLGRAQEAFEQIKRATEIDPNLSTAWQYRGELEMGRGDCLSAVESLSRALVANPTAIALQKREECYRRLGLLARAEQDRCALEELNAGTLK